MSLQSLFFRSPLTTSSSTSTVKAVVDEPAHVVAARVADPEVTVVRRRRRWVERVATDLHQCRCGRESGQREVLTGDGRGGRRWFVDGRWALGSDCLMLVVGSYCC